MATTVQRVGHLSYSVDSGIEKTATEYFLVRFDSAQAGPVPAEMTAGVPVYGDVHPEDAGRWVRQKRASMVDESNRRDWLVQVDYSSAVVPNPLTQPDDISWDFSEATENYFLDNASTPKPVVNTAGEPFDKLLEREKGTIQCTVKRNQASYSASTALSFLHMLNSDAITVDGNSISIGQALMGGITAGGIQKVAVGAIWVYYRVVSYPMKFRVSWDDKVEDRGYNELIAGVRRPIVVGNPGVRTDKPWPLHLGAKKTTPTDPGDTLTFTPYLSTAFATLSFT